MTTVLDPLGTPSPTYNRSGKAIVEISDSRDGGDPPLSIQQLAEKTYYEIGFTYPSGGTGAPLIELPANAEVGDEVFINFTISASMDAVPASGDSIRSGAGTVSVVSGSSLNFIKIGPSIWRHVI